jgi:hypothetical protein
LSHDTGRRDEIRVIDDIVVPALITLHVTVTSSAIIRARDAGVGFSIKFRTVEETAGAIIVRTL